MTLPFGWLGRQKFLLLYIAYSGQFCYSHISIFVKPHHIREAMSFFNLSDFTFFGLLPLPLWKVLFDTFFAVLMWMMLLRFAVIVLFGDSPTMRALRRYVQLTDIVIHVLKLVTPAVLTSAARSIYVAFLLLLLRYYSLPALNDYPVYGLTNLPFEDHLAAGISALSRLISMTGS